MGIDGAAGAPGGALGFVAPGSCLAAGRLFDRPYTSAMYLQATVGLTAIPAGAAFAAFFRLGIRGGWGEETTISPLRLGQGGNIPLVAGCPVATDIVELL